LDLHASAAAPLLQASKLQDAMESQELRIFKMLRILGMMMCLQRKVGSDLIGLYEVGLMMIIVVFYCIVLYCIVRIKTLLDWGILI
jgi:hypothetical protein